MKVKQKIAVPNLILISGNGRNSGKTLFAVKLIEHFSKSIAVTGVKLSPHFHYIDSKRILLNTKNFILCEEKEITQKDSSLMLQAGAERVFFIMTKQVHLHEAFKRLQYFISPSVIICESGGLQKEITPGVLFFVKEKGSGFNKNLPKETRPIIVEREDASFDFNIQKLLFQNQKINLKNGAIQ